MSDPFGAFAPSRQQQWVREVARRLPDGYFGRRAASLLLRIAGAKNSNRPFDVDIFGSQRARLNPADNYCEKRVFITPQFWEGREREALAQAIRDCREDAFYFADVGANAGLYTLFARSEALKRRLAFRALCIEPDQEMRRRLQFNLEASGASDEVEISSFAASASAGTLRFAPNVKSRGQSRIADSGSVNVEARPLLALVRAAGFPRIDALKIDVEGHELPILKAFFDQSPAELRPRILLMETSHDDPDQGARRVVRGAGYMETLTTRTNSVFALH